MNTRFWVVVVIMVCVGGYAYQPAFGKCVTNKVTVKGKGTTFSNCADATSAEIQKSEGVHFKKSADDDLSRRLNDKPSRQFKESVSEEGKDGVKPVDKKKSHFFKETPREPKSHKGDKVIRVTE